MVSGPAKEIKKFKLTWTYVWDVNNNGGSEKQEMWRLPSRHQSLIFQGWLSGPFFLPRITPAHGRLYSEQLWGNIQSVLGIQHGSTSQDPNLMNEEQKNSSDSRLNYDHHQSKENAYDQIRLVCVSYCPTMLAWLSPCIIGYWRLYSAKCNQQNEVLVLVIMCVSYFDTTTSPLLHQYKCAYKTV